MTNVVHNGMTKEIDALCAPNIAIIGMEGCGKTVLVTTLAKRLSTIDDRGVFLNPQGVKTLKYVEHVWHTLQSGDWPPSTPPGELFELRWKFQVVGELECDVRLIDAAGQDLRLLFGDEQFLSIDLLPGRLQVLADYCRSSEIIFFLINLKDFVGQGNSEYRTANEAAIKSAMDCLAGVGPLRRFCLVLTQVDLYRDLAHECGGFLELAAECVPYVFSAHVRAHHIAVYPVSAVADTEVAVDQNGTPRRVPIAGFRSDGLDELVGWLVEQVQEVKAELDNARPASPPTIPNVPPPAYPAPEESTWEFIQPYFSRYIKPYGVRIAIGIFVLLVLRGCVSGCDSRSDNRSPAPVATYYCKDDPGTFDDGVIIYGTVRNNGAAGRVRVIARVTENGVLVETKGQDFYLRSGQTADFRFQMNNIHDVKNPHKAIVSTEVP